MAIENIVQGTRVRLTKDHGVGAAGDEGIVTGCDSNGQVAIQITNKSDCTPVTKLLLGVPSDKVATDTRCA